MRDVAKLVGMGRLSGVDFILDPDRTVIIGRSPACDVVLSEPVASREHAEVQRVEGVWWIRDRSSNGTWINGQRVREQSIQDGDRLKIGATELRFVISATDSPVSLTRPLISRKPTKPAANSSIQPLLFGMILLFIGCTGVVVTGVALRPLLANRTQETPLDPRLAQAQTLLNEGKAEEAFNLLQLILKDSPNNPVAQQLYAKAVSARAQPATPSPAATPVATKAKPTPEAPVPVVKPVATSKTIETPKPVFQNNAAILQQGEAALAAGDTAKAIQIWEGLISTAPTSPEAAAASVRIAQVQKTNSSRSDTSWQAAQNAIKAGDYIAARNYLKDVLRSDPNREGAQSTLDGIQKKLRTDADAAYKEGRRLEDIDDRSGASSQYRKVMSLIGDRNDELYKRAEARLAGVSG
jgi:pSer/pThr/pTyr-binding forkhead associated (FHA) protein